MTVEIAPRKNPGAIFLAASLLSSHKASAIPRAATERRPSVRDDAG